MDFQSTNTTQFVFGNLDFIIDGVSHSGKSAENLGVFYIEWEAPNGAQVNMDIPEFNNVKASGYLGEGPHQPHIGYQTPGKGKNRIRGHIFVDNLPATR